MKRFIDNPTSTKNWYVCWGTQANEYLDERGRVTSTKIFMSAKQAKYLESKFGLSAQANMTALGA